MSIQVLSQDVVNQIAAGEVVERPAHLVKELLENSLDAESTKIQIDVNFGGKFIKISDNGSGIKKDELFLALQRHATSKIRKTDDLWNLHTYGFRGEALASVAAVSKLTLASKTKNQEKAYQIKSNFGALSEVMESSIEQGTQITIEALFENVPARLKFLKSDSAELAQIRNVVRALSLAYPDVEIKLIENGKLDLFFKSGSLKNTDHTLSDINAKALERTKQILNLDRVFFFEHKREHFHVKAYFSSPHDTQKTSKNIWIFAQKRWIQDRAIQAAVMDAYRSLLMHGEYPQVVLDIECDPEFVDVNIHPTKSQVKFRDSSEAFRAVHSTLRQGLELAPWIERVQLQDHHESSAIQSSYLQQKKSLYQINPEQHHQMTLNDESKFNSFNSTQFKTKNNWVSEQNAFDSSLSVREQLQNLAVTSADAMGARLNGSDKKNEAKGFWSSLQVIGQLNLTYIVCQKNDRMILVDQHAAHERVAFEKLMNKWKGGKIDQQDYLFPLAIDLSVEKVEALLAKEHEILKMGIEIEALGPNVIGVKSAPLFVKEAALPKIFDKLAHDLIEYGGSYSLEKSIADLFATMACHSVVRAGQSLSASEMEELLVSMDEFPLSSFCPHGRPVSIEFSFNEIEKSFGRTL